MRDEMRRQSSFPDCCSTRHMKLFMLVHSRLNGCWTHLNWQTVMVMMFISPVLCPCITQPHTVHTEGLAYTHEWTLIWFCNPLCILFCSASIRDNCIHGCFWKGKSPPSIPPRHPPSPPAPLFPLHPRIPLLLPCLSHTRFPFKWAALGGIQMCKRCRWLTGFFSAHD